MKEPWIITEKKWESISKHLPRKDKRKRTPYTSDHICFEAMCHLIWEMKPIIKVKDLDKYRYPRHSTLIPRLQSWHRSGSLQKMMEVYVNSLSIRDRKQFENKLQAKYGWIASVLRCI